MITFTPQNLIRVNRLAIVCLFFLSAASQAQTPGQTSTAITTRINVTPPVVEISIDGRSLGPGPVFYLSPGKHKIIIQKSGYISRHETITVTPEQHSFSFELARVVNLNVTIKSEPSGAALSVNGNHYGQTPCLLSLPAGEHRLTLEKEGFQPLHVTFYAQKSHPEKTFILKPHAQTQSTAEGSENHDTTDMVFVPGAWFQMGSIANNPDEAPRHRIFVDGFFISKNEITQAQWQQVMENNPSQFQDAFHPIENITWLQALEYCNKRSRQEGLQPCYTIGNERVFCDFRANGYRLPTEAEWEFAARLAFGSLKETALTERAWFVENSNQHTHPVATLAADAIGCYDLLGNVWEWCWDWYSAEAYQERESQNPRGPVMGTSKVIRGGSWFSEATALRITNRYFYAFDQANPAIGLRPVRRP